MILILLTALLISVSSLLFISVKKNLEYMELIDGLEENLKDSIELLNEYYVKIDKKSKLELFLDEPVTRELVEDIRGSKKAVKNAAEKLSIYLEETDENDQ
jgi:hypothetical protein